MPDTNVFNPMDKLDPVSLRQLKAKIGEWGPHDRASSNLTSLEAAVILQVIECGLYYAPQMRALHEKIVNADKFTAQIQKAHAEQVTLRRAAERKAEELARQISLRDATEDEANAAAAGGVDADEREEEEDEEDEEPWEPAAELEAARAKLAAIRIIAGAILSATEDEE